MVDFQSRDTRRGPTVDDESVEDGDDAETDEGERDATGETDDDGEAEPQEPAATDEGAAADADPLATDVDTSDADGTDSGADERVEDAAGADDRSEGAAEHGDGPDAAAAGTAGSATEETSPASEPTTPARAVDAAVVTVAGDRAALEETVTAAFEAAGHAVVRRERLRGGYDGIQQMVDTLVGRQAIDVVVTVGGAGLAADEMTIEAVHPLLEKALPGFGEAFRTRLADHVGTGIVGVRSTAGVSDGTLVFCLPGDPDAAALAVEEILATEAPVLLDQLDG